MVSYTGNILGIQNQMDEEVECMIGSYQMKWSDINVITHLLQPAWLPPLPSVDVTANLPGYIILSGYQNIHYKFTNYLIYGYSVAIK